MLNLKYQGIFLELHQNLYTILYSPQRIWTSATARLYFQDTYVAGNADIFVTNALKRRFSETHSSKVQSNGG